MSNNLVISIDAMGGDNAPQVVIDGLALANKKYPDVHYLVFGDEQRVNPLVAKHPQLQKNCTVIHAPEAVLNEDKPSQVIRNRQTSMFMAIDAVKQGEAKAVVSAGNTGALMAISKMILKTIHGIHRPAIVSIMPNKNGQYIMLDLGANTECSAVNLAEFALMGNVVAKNTLDIERPRVALLNIGAEEQKGKEEIKEAANLIKNSKLDFDFVGFVEPHEMHKGNVDVVVSDGFTGNIALKTLEGTAKFISSSLKDSFKSSLIAKFGLPLVYPALKNLKKKMDPRLYNGAMFVGLNGISVKSHGGTDEVGFSVAVGNAIKLARQDFVSTIKKELEQVDIEELTQDVIYDLY